ncbi:MAG: MerR family transcriptional regulator [Acidovorax sp.]|uniref:MerR family transcriptional regulator n=1 Tax=Acidovorax sp. TaxID=1872122 RepID=UPI00391AC21C
MSAHAPTPPAELLDEDSVALTLEALARACCMDADWVAARLQEGLLEPGAAASGDPAAWRFGGATVVRARRIAHLEVTFDADPHLAALTTDLIEEVTALRQQLRHLQRR